ncbi:hypothetical protein BT96DRAFT_930143 [Gymnopus androsaceus JB14]|uniref:Uncharacterized protein n=1 Tax=Gymnopus androsaceus JB14 TaxID=1447944 RepID=A0A6A4GBI1_9AGAR|nr:hypothetical protein BT96DRAFT_930143 [Gymnopus androsaceus JB14]
MSSKKKTAYCDPRFIPGPNEISKSRIKKNLKQIKITDELEVKDFLSSMAAHVARTEGCATFYVKEIFKKKYEQLLEQNPEARDIVQQTTKRKRTHTASSAARKKPCCRNCGLLMEGHNRDRCSSIADPPLQLKTSDLLSMPPSPPPQHSPRSYSSEIIEISDTETTTPIASSLKSKVIGFPTVCSVLIISFW